MITEEDSTDTQSTSSTILQPPTASSTVLQQQQQLPQPSDDPPPSYTSNIYIPPRSDVNRHIYAQYMLDNIKSGDDMCTDPGCPYNRWLYSEAAFPQNKFVEEWEQDRTRRHFDRLEEIIMSPTKFGPSHLLHGGSSSRGTTSTEAKDDSESSYPVVTLPKSERDAASHSNVKSSLCCFGAKQKSFAPDQYGGRNDVMLEEGSYLPSPRHLDQGIPPPPYSIAASMGSSSVHELREIPTKSQLPPPSRSSTPSSCSTCPPSSTRSSCSCCASSMPVDPTAPHAFTIEAGISNRRGIRPAGAAGRPSKKTGLVAWVPRCNTVCCASLTFMSICVIGEFLVAQLLTNKDSLATDSF